MIVLTTPRFRKALKHGKAHSAEAYEAKQRLYVIVSIARSVIEETMTPCRSNEFDPCYL